METLPFTSRTLILCLMLTGCTAFVPMAKLPWSFSPVVCLPMTDPSYDPLGVLGFSDVSEEWREGSFGSETLFCKRGCCGDNRNPSCCTETSEVEETQFELYKLVSIIAAGVGGLCIIAAITLVCLKMYLKKRRLIRDINAINKMNNMKDLAKEGKIVKVKGSKNKSPGPTDTKPQKFFKSRSKTPIIHIDPPTSAALNPLDKPSLQPVSTKVSTAPQETSIMMPRETGFNQSITKEETPPAYATLEIPDYLSNPPTRAVGDLPVFLPTKPTDFTFSSGPGSAFPTPANAGTSSTSMAPKSQPLATISKPAAFSTPMYNDPVVFSGPFISTPPATYKTPSQTGSNLSSASGGKTKDETSSSRASTDVSSPLPDIPWDDNDLLLYFSDPISSRK